MHPICNLYYGKSSDCRLSFLLLGMALERREKHGSSPETNRSQAGEQNPDNPDPHWIRAFYPLHWTASQPGDYLRVQSITINSSYHFIGRIRTKHEKEDIGVCGGSSKLGKKWFDNRYGIWLFYRLVELVNEQISSRWHVSLCQSQQERPLSHPLACHTYLVCQGFAGKVKQPVCSRTWLVTSAHQPWTTGVWAGPLGKTWCLILC